MIGLGADALYEHYQCDRLRQVDLRWTERAGIPLKALTEPDPLLKAQIVERRGGCFDFSRHVDEPGRVHFVNLVRDECGDPLDIIAWHMSSPKVLCWWNRA